MFISLDMHWICIYIFPFPFPEPIREEKPVKVRHYDQDNIRNYLKKQKADRLKQEREKEDRRRKEQEKKKQQLELLAKHTKKAVKVKPGQVPPRRGEELKMEELLHKVSFCSIKNFEQSIKS